MTKTALIIGLLVELVGSCGRSDTNRPARAMGHGGTITVAIGRPGAIDPANAYEPNAVFVTRTLCDTLLTVDPRTGDLRPGLADSWLVSNNGTRIMVRLRRGARFSDGSSITARDVAAAISRAAGAEFAGSAAELLRPIAGFDEIRGEKRARTARNRRELAGIAAVTDRAVEISLTRPNAAFARILTHPVTAPVPRRLSAGASAAFSRRPICAGAYRLARPWTPGDATIALDRTPGYSGPRPANADRIEFRVGADAGTADVGRVAADDPTATVRAPSPRMEYIGLPAAANSPFANPSFRRALSLAIDRTAIARDVYRGDRDPATGFIPPSAGRSLARRSPCAGTVPPTANPAEARAALAAAGVDPNAMRVPLSYSDEFDNGALAAAIAAQWQTNLGLAVEQRPMPYEEFTAKATEQSGFDGAFRVSWSTSYPSADMWLAPLFATSGIGQTNLARYSNATFDRDLDKRARQADDPLDQRLEYQHLEDRLCRDLPLLPITFDTVSYRIDPRLAVGGNGSPIDPTTGEPRLHALYVR